MCITVRRSERGTGGGLYFPIGEFGLDNVLRTLDQPSRSQSSTLRWAWPFWLASENPAASSRCLISRKGSGLSRPRPQPRLSEPSGTAWLGAARNEAPVPPSDLLELLLRSRPGWRHRPRGIARHTRPFAPDSRSKWPLHSNILSQGSQSVSSNRQLWICCSFKFSSFLAFVRPWRGDSVHARVGDQLAHMLVCVNDDAEIDAVYVCFSPLIFSCAAVRRV